MKREGWKHFLLTQNITLNQIKKTGEDQGAQPTRPRTPLSLPFFSPSANRNRNRRADGVAGQTGSISVPIPLGFKI